MSMKSKRKQQLTLGDFIMATYELLEKHQAERTIGLAMVAGWVVFQPQPHSRIYSDEGPQL